MTLASCKITCFRVHSVPMHINFICVQQRWGCCSADLLSQCKCAQEMWEAMQGNNPFERKGAKVNLNRFMGAVKTGKEQEGMWTFSLFGYVLACMDQGYFHGAKFRRPASRQPGVASSGSCQAGCCSPGCPPALASRVIEE